MRFKDDVALTADADLIWKRVSDLNWMPKFWPNVKAVDALSMTGPQAIGRVHLDVGECEARFLETGQTLVIYYTKGPITGTQRVSIRGNRLEEEWDIAFHGLNELLSRSREGGIRAATH